jgi:translation initiation factor 3 subunit G
MSSKGGASWADMDADGDAGPSFRDEVKDEAVFKSHIIETKPDAQGIKTVTEFTRNGGGEKIKIVKRIKVTQRPVRVNKHVIARRKIAKFGDCRGQGVGAESGCTYESSETINLDIRPKARDEGKDEDNKLKTLGDTNASIVVCRNCGQTGHWTLKCPKRGEIVPKGMDADDIPDRKGNSTASAGANANAYVLPHMRAGAAAGGGSSMHTRSDRDESLSLRVTNLSEDVEEDDLQELFSSYGDVARVFICRNKPMGNEKQGRSRGFAFISYRTRTDAQRAIDNLHGYGFDNLILHVEWAKPREETPGGGGGGEGGGAAARQGGRRF